MILRLIIRDLTFNLYSFHQVITIKKQSWLYPNSSSKDGPSTICQPYSPEPATIYQPKLSTICKCHTATSVNPNSATTINPNSALSVSQTQNHLLTKPSTICQLNSAPSVTQTQHHLSIKINGCHVLSCWQAIASLFPNSSVMILNRRNSSKTYQCTRVEYIFIPIYNE